MAKIELKKYQAPRFYCEILFSKDILSGINSGEDENGSWVKDPYS